MASARGAYAEAATNAPTMTNKILSPIRGDVFMASLPGCCRHTDNNAAAGRLFTRREADGAVAGCKNQRGRLRGGLNLRSVAVRSRPSITANAPIAVPDPSRAAAIDARAPIAGRLPDDRRCVLNLRMDARRARRLGLCVGRNRHGS